MVRFTKAGLFFKFTFLSLSHLNTPLCSYNQTNWSISIIHLGSLVTVLHKEIPPKSLFSSSWTRCFSHRVHFITHPNDRRMNLCKQQGMFKCLPLKTCSIVHIKSKNCSVSELLYCLPFIS